MDASCKRVETFWWLYQMHAIAWYDQPALRKPTSWKAIYSFNELLAIGVHYDRKGKSDTCTNAHGISFDQYIESMTPRTSLVKMKCFSPDYNVSRRKSCVSDVSVTLPFKGRNCRALDEHVLTTLVTKLRRLWHLQRKDISRINSHLRDNKKSNYQQWW